jgi:hypothetical protein
MAKATQIGGSVLIQQIIRELFNILLIQEAEWKGSVLECEQSRIYVVISKNPAAQQVKTDRDQ